jgi:oligoribonuclease NrnB/cAMP/cGMP phosphodiesterase (DHH superfamily)
MWSMGTADSSDEYEIDLDARADDPTLDDRAFLPLGLTEDGVTMEELLNNAIDDVISHLLSEGGEPETLHIAISDFSDPDGKTCATLYKHKHRDSDTTVVWVPAKHNNEDGKTGVLEVLERVSKIAPSGSTVTFTDLAPNGDESETYLDLFAKFVEDDVEFRIRDHHEWPREILNGVPDGVECVVDSGQDEPVCASEVVLREDYADAPETMQDLVKVTSVRDLWKDDHPEFNTRAWDLSQFSFHCEPREYPEVTMEYGADVQDHPDVDSLVTGVREEIQHMADAADWYTIQFDSPVYLGENIEFNENTGVFEYLREQKKEDADPIPIPIIHSETTDALPVDVTEVMEITFAMVYGTASRSDVGAELLDRGADAVAVVRGFGQASFRSEEEKPIARTFATRFNGGGHAVAAGSNPGLVLNKSDYMSRIEDGEDPEEEQFTHYQKHWATRGEMTKEYVLETIQDTFDAVATEQTET